MPAGSLRLADLGVYTRTVVQTIADAGNSWRARIQTNSRIRLPGQPNQSILEVEPVFGTTDQCERLVIMDTTGQIAASLLIQRVPPAVAAHCRQQGEDDVHHSSHRIASRHATARILPRASRRLHTLLGGLPMGTPSTQIFLPRWYPNELEKAWRLWVYVRHSSTAATMWLSGRRVLG